MAIEFLWITIPALLGIIWFNVALVRFVKARPADYAKYIRLGKRIILSGIATVPATLLLAKLASLMDARTALAQGAVSAVSMALPFSFPIAFVLFVCGMSCLIGAGAARANATSIGPCEGDATGEQEEGGNA